MAIPKPLAITSGDVTSSIGSEETLTGEDSVAYAGETISVYTWELLSAPPGSEAALSATDEQSITFEPDVVGTYRIFLKVGTSTGRQSEQDPTRAPTSAFVYVRVPTLNRGWNIPAKGERDWDEKLYTIIDDLDSLTGISGTLTSTCTGEVLINHLVYVSDNGEVSSALADNTDTSKVIGMVTSIDGDQVTLSFGGRVTGLSGIVANTVYYLSTVGVGEFTDTPTDTEGEFIVPIGYGYDTTSIILKISQPVEM
jgi:hypothetical protein